MIAYREIPQLSIFHQGWVLCSGIIFDRCRYDIHLPKAAVRKMQNILVRIEPDECPVPGGSPDVATVHLVEGVLGACGIGVLVRISVLMPPELLSHKNFLE